MLRACWQVAALSVERMHSELGWWVKGVRNFQSWLLLAWVRESMHKQQASKYETKLYPGATVSLI